MRAPLPPLLLLPSLLLLSPLLLAAPPTGGEPRLLATRAAVLGRVGDAVALRCRVLRPAGRTVSWIRSGDLQILSHAGAVFTADSRVSCSEAPLAADDADEADEADGAEAGATAGAGGAVHTLRIERLRVSDAGRYECQLNTEPKTSRFFELTVLERAPRVAVRALGGAEAWGAAGGAARLACEARYEAAEGAPAAALPPLRLRWSREGAALEARGGVTLATEREAGRVRSRLTLAALAPADEGRYECSAGGAGASLRLRLRPAAPGSAGEAEAMQRDQEPTARGPPLVAPLSYLSLLLSLLLSPLLRGLR